VALVVCLASQRDPNWGGTYATVVSPADEHPSGWAPYCVRGGRSVPSAARGHIRRMRGRMSALDLSGVTHERAEGGEMALPVLFRVCAGANRKVLLGLFRRSVTVAVAVATAGLGLAGFVPPTSASTSAAVSHRP
jgi:hypothetical protein